MWFAIGFVCGLILVMDYAIVVIGAKIDEIGKENDEDAK